MSPAPSAIAPGGYPRGSTARAQLSPRSAPLAFRLHHLPKAIFDRHECEGKPTEILHSQTRLGQGYHIYPSDGFICPIVDQFVANVAADTRINGRFATIDIRKLKGHLVDQVCMTTGGPCIYSGRDMKTTHAGMKISNGDFGAFVEDLVKALDMFKVPAQEKGELLGLLGRMKKDIVEAP